MQELRARLPHPIVYTVKQIVKCAFQAKHERVCVQRVRVVACVWARVCACVCGLVGLQIK